MLLVRPPIPERSRVMTQTKRDILGFGVGITTPHSKKLIVTKVEQRNKLDRFNEGGRKKTRYVIAKSLSALEVLCRKRSLSAGSEKMERAGDR
jgi:hypothetical protein